nr:thiamine-phosphate kinase [uncultured Moraxella sp.]
MSEFSLIYQHFKNCTPKNPLTQIGIGDDCAVSNIPPNAQLVSCVDTLVMGRHFPHSTSAYAVGFKSVAVNLSDLASMGATPYAILLGLSLPSHFANDEFLGEFTQGLADICRAFNVDLIGGDTTKSEILTISVTALGFVPSGQAILRSGAKVGNVVCVSGEIGSASFALKQILNGEKPDLQNALDLPNPQIKLGQKLIGFANSMIDISDGLGQDLGHILTASDVGAVLDLAKIPCNRLLQTLPNDEKWQHILNGGDDYQLCFTMSQENFAKFNELYPNEIFAIGEIVADKGLKLVNHGEKVNFTINGWQHF